MERNDTIGMLYLDAIKNDIDWGDQYPVVEWNDDAHLVITDVSLGTDDHVLVDIDTDNEIVSVHDAACDALMLAIDPNA